MGGEEKSGPGDEYEVLRARLLAGLRRHPGDTRSLMRAAAALSRMAAAERRLSPRKARDLAERFRAVFESLDEHILPEE